MEQTVGRFAPTPSGRMHLGNVLCCLLAWLAAKSRGGRIVLRIEDLDTLRAPLRYAQVLEDDLRWLGLDWDEGGLADAGPHGPYCQSRRGAIYAQALQELTRQGRTYPCFCSRAELHAAQAPHLSDGRVLYAGTCRNLSDEEIAARAARRAPAVRLRVPEETVVFRDLRLGPQRIDLARQWGDFLIRRSDGVFCYQLAAAVDDARMGVTQVVRGADLAASTAPQLLLDRLLGLPAPVQFGHIPLLLSPDGTRLSKRDGALDLGALRQILPGPQPILGLLASLCGLIDRYEPVAAADLIPAFDWARLPRGDVRLPARLPFPLDEA